jgi:hypothetical protein
MADRYIDPNSGAAPQPGGYGGYGAAPVIPDGDSFSDAAVADDITEAQEAAAKKKAADEAAVAAEAPKAPPVKAQHAKSPAKSTASKS